MPITRLQLNNDLTSVLSPVIDIPQHLQSNQMMLDYVDQEIATVTGGINLWSTDKPNYYTKNQVDVIAGTKANATHTHAITDVTGLQTALDGKAALSHTHVISDVSGLQAALDGKAALSHTHAIADVISLQTTLDAKLDITQHKLSNLLAAVTGNTINNSTYTQEWQWSLPSGGNGLIISGTRTPVSAPTTEENLLSISMANVTASQPVARKVRGLKISMPIHVAASKSAGQTQALYVETTADASIPVGQNGFAVVVSGARNGVQIDSKDSAILATVTDPDDYVLHGTGPGRFSPNAAITTLIPILNVIGLTTANSNAAPTLKVTGGLNGATWNHAAIEVSGVGAGHGNIAINTGAITDFANRKAQLSIGPALAAGPQLNLKPGGVAPTTPVDGDMWITSNHFWVRLNGTSYQLDQQGSGGGVDFYSTDGTLTGNRAVNQSGYSMTFNNSSLFRIVDDGSDTGIYDFNNGVDFLVANATKSYSIITNLISGINLKAVDITGSITREIVVDSTQIKIDSSVLKLVNLPTYADDTAAGTGGLVTNSIYKTATGEVRIKL